MKQQNPFAVASAIKNDAFNDVPNVWPEIRKKINRKIADKLLKELDCLPSPEGRVLTEIIYEMTESIQKFEKRGA